tara:strand:+ start:31 stop:420 length:390 start_codon:yes stop_codon:yes gene_type:complete
MATLNITLSMNSKNAATDELNFTVTDALTTTDPMIASAKTSVSTVGASNIIQPDTSGATYYLYVKHTGTSDGSSATTENLGVELTGDVPFAVLAPNEFCFLPVGGGSFGVQLQAASGTVVAEYAWFKKG